MTVGKLIMSETSLSKMALARSKLHYGEKILKSLSKSIFGMPVEILMAREKKE
jgi:hypothetical protein